MQSIFANGNYHRNVQNNASSYTVRDSSYSSAISITHIVLCTIKVTE